MSIWGDFGDFPDVSLPWPFYEQHLRGTVPKGSATQSTFPKKVGNPAVWNREARRFSFSQISGKEKTHKHKQICGIVPGLGGCQNVVYVFFGVIPYGGENT